MLLVTYLAYNRNSLFLLLLLSRYVYITAVQVIEKIINGVQNHGFQCKGWIESPLKGAEGNIEFLACFSRQAVISKEVEKQ